MLRLGACCAISILSCQDPGRADGWQLVYEASDSLWVVNAAGGKSTALKESPSYYIPSPDGKKRLFFQDDGDQELWVSDSDGQNRIKLTDNAVIDRSPCWTKGGDQVVFSSEQSGRWQLWKVDVDGKRLQQLTTSRGFCEEPGESCTPVAFHPTKPWLAWVTKDETLTLWDAAARKEVRRLAPKGLRASSFAFSRDGSSLAIGVLDMEGVPDNEDVIAVWSLEKDQALPAASSSAFQRATSGADSSMAV